MNKSTELRGLLSHSGGPERRTSPVSMKIGSCRVEPDLDRITGPAGITQVEPKAMAVLVYLARFPEKVVGADELIETIWLGRPMGDNPVYRCIAQLRRALGDNPRTPRYIVTVPTKGYRLIAPVAELEPVTPPDSAADQSGAGASRGFRSGAQVTLLVALTALAVMLWFERFDQDVAPPETGPATLAVLPFENLTGDPGQETFADVLTDAVLSRLATFPESHVIARTSSFALKDSDYEVSRIARLLGARFVLQGIVRQQGDRLRVSVVLVDRDGFEVWSDTFDPGPGGSFSLHDEIAAAVATKLTPRLTSRPASVPQHDFGAYQHYVLGREALVRRPLHFQPVARAHFDRAIEIDPRFAQAYAGRAVALAFTAGAGQRENDASLAQAWSDVRRAIALNPDVAEAHAARGFLLQMGEPFVAAGASSASRSEPPRLDRPVLRHRPPGRCAGGGEAAGTADRASRRNAGRCRRIDRDLRHAGR